MKKLILIFGIIALLTNCATVATAPDELDMAIRDASDYLNDNIPRGSKIVILNMQSDSEALSDYIIDELISNAVNDRIFTVVDRAQLDMIRAEQNIQHSGEVNDRDALAIGKFFEAQFIISGAISELADRYRMRIRALNVQTAQVQAQYNRNISAGKTIMALLKSSSGGSRSGTSVASSNTRQTTQAASNTTRQAATVYKIGDTGPAGGLIFYDKGNSIGGWRYLEAALEDLGPSIFLSGAELDSLPKSVYESWEKTMGDSGRGVGKGKYNTEYIMQVAHARGGGFGWAVQRCEIYESGGFDDWFLPSRDELNFMYGNLYMRGLGNIKPEEYWSSSTWTDTWGSYRAWYINFYDGKHDNQNAAKQRRIRPVRQF
ncbi:MAG: DUF1566 domain-containing protein [Treponema sp.]|nr:DUF1566 domain-containing protein [Treponema sp.]MCL2251873.1 DUF1566 domain-containing protein [Treponema sp.]